MLQKIINLSIENNIKTLKIDGTKLADLALELRTLTVDELLTCIVIFYFLLNFLFNFALIIYKKYFFVSF